MLPLSYDRYYAETEAQTAGIVEVLRSADPALPVPTCPGWTLTKLIRHVGRVHRWAAASVTRRATEYVDPKGLDDAVPPEDTEGLAAWLTAGAERVVQAIREAGPEARVWTWADEQSAGFWARRVAHETLVHRADASLAVDGDFEPAPEVAADGISELLGLIASPKVGERRTAFAELTGDGQTLHLHATERRLGAAGEWQVCRTPDGVVWEHGHAKGDVAVRGPAADLLLVLYRRLPASKVEVLGDERLLDHWLAHTAF
ncbi:MAG: hypothetical protein QOE54_567 [Streptosporangiaceae bacterium]|nr:hypothetical protein [Streptosporangiaceae bacterium]